MSPQILSDLRTAERGRSLLEAAGLPLELWEACCLAFSDRALLHREVARLDGNGHEPAGPDPDFAGRLREIRVRCDPLVARLRDFIGPPPRGPEETERREMMLGFIVGSPAARESAERWVSDPAAHRAQAAPKLQVIENLVERYRLALRSTPPPPGAPGRPMAVPGDRQVLLRWTPGRDAAAHVLLRAPGPGAPPVEIARPDSTMYLDAGLENGATYVYTVRALNAAGVAADSATVEAALPAAPPSPAALSARPGNGRVALSWEPSPGAERYSVRRAPAPDGPFTELASAGETSYVDTTAANGSTYAYTVAALNAGRESPATAAALATPVEPPPAPETLVVACGNAQVTLTWTPSPRATLYRIERAPAPEGPFAECATSADPSCTDAGLENGLTYAFRVVALNDGGESAPSTAAAAVPVAPPPVPAGLKGRHGDARVTIHWEPSPGATHYRVKRATDRNGPWETVATTPRTTFADPGLVNGTTYFYRVRAVNAGGKSAYSTRVRATPLAPPPAPGGLTASAGDAEVALAWTAVPGAIKYVVKRSTAPKGPFSTSGRPEEPSFTDRAVRNRTTYTYVVSAISPVGEGEGAAVEATPMPLPVAPEQVSATPGDAKVSLAWAPVPEAVSYRVKRALSPEGPYSTVGTPDPPACTDAGLENGITHFYVVSALNARGEGPESIVVQAVPAPPPPAPSGLRATPKSGRVDLAWEGWPTVERFRVKRSERPGGPYAVVGNPVAPAYVDYGVRNGTTYRYLVTAISPVGESAPTEELAVTPTAGVAAGTDEVPTLEQFEAPFVGGGGLAPGVDLERLMDLRRVEQLRTLFDGTGQKFEAWEMAALIAREGQEVRRTLDTLLRLKNDGDSDAFEAGALAFFDRILAVRAELGGLVRRLRAYLDLLGLPPPAPEEAEIALSFVVSADRSRSRAEAWLEDPLVNQGAAAAYFRKALEIARGYLEAMQRSAEKRGTGGGYGSDSPAGGGRPA